MRLLLLFSTVLILIVYSCGPDTTGLQEKMEALTTSWEKEDKEVLGWVEMIETANRDWLDTLGHYRVSEEARLALKPAMRAKLDSITAQTDLVSRNYGKLRSEADGFMSVWSSQTKDLASLREELAAGKVEVAAFSEKLEKLELFLNATPRNISTWKVLWDDMELKKPVLIGKMHDFAAQMAPPPPPAPAVIQP